jgi:hypothetical protein
MKQNSNNASCSKLQGALFDFIGYLTIMIEYFRAFNQKKNVETGSK